MFKNFIFTLFLTTLLIVSFNIIIAYYYQFNKLKVTFTSTNFKTVEIKPKLFCIILTSKKQYKTRPKIVYESWAHKCDDFRFISMLPNDILNELAKQNNLSKLQIEFQNESIEFKLDGNIKFLQIFSELLQIVFLYIMKQLSNKAWFNILFR